MNTSSSTQPHITINTFKQSKNKKKNLPISINSNPTPSSFLFNNKVSKVATSYKNIGDQINTYEKLRQLQQKGKIQSNIIKVNNVFSINSFNSKGSQISNNSQITKNTSNAISSNRGNPSKNISNVLFVNHNLMNSVTGYTNCTSGRCSKHKTISKERYNDAINEKNKHNIKLKVKKQIRRQKSIISLMPSSKGNTMISFKSNKSNNNSVYNNINVFGRYFRNNNNTSINVNNNKGRRVVSNVSHNVKRKKFISNNKKAFNTIIVSSDGNNIRNKSDNLTLRTSIITKGTKNRSVSTKHNMNYSKKKTFNQITNSETIEVDSNKSDIQYEDMLKRISMPYHSCKNKNSFIMNKNGNVLTTNNEFNTLYTNGNNQIKTIKVDVVKKRGLSHENITLPKETQLKQNETISHHRNNKSININQLILNKYINNNNEKKQHNHTIKAQQHNVLKQNENNMQMQQQIKINLNPLFQDIKVTTTSKTKKNTTNEKVNQKHSSNNNNNKKTKNLHKQNHLYRNTIQSNIQEIDKQTLRNNNNILNKNLFENENIIFDNAPYKEDPFDNLNDVVRLLHFNSINISHPNIFSIDHNPKYLSFQHYFDSTFDHKVKSKHSNTTTTITSAHKAVSTGNKSSERKNFHNVSMSTQDNSNKKYISSPVHKINYCN